MQHKLLFSAIALALSYSAQAVIVPEGTQLDEKQHIVINNGAEPTKFLTRKKPKVSLNLTLLINYLKASSPLTPKVNFNRVWLKAGKTRRISKRGHSIYVKMPNGQMVILLPRTISCSLGAV